MWFQFLAQDGHFALNLLAALVFLAITWLYFDAWLYGRAKKEIMYWMGFGALALSFLVQSTLIEQSAFGSSIFGNGVTDVIVVLRLLGYGLLIGAYFGDPLQKIPTVPGLVLKEETPTKPATPLVKAPALSAPVVVGKSLLPVGALTVAGLYWRRATTGLERHLKPVAYGFLLLGLSDLAGAASLLRTTDNPTLYSWVAAFGWIWIVEQLFLLAAVIVLGKWIWSYLLRRFLSQLFMIFVTACVVIFLLVGIGFTTLLMRNIRNDALHNLDTAARVLNYALKAKQSETMTGAQQVASTSGLAQALQSSNRSALGKMTRTYLADKKQSSLIIVNQSGQVMLRAEDVSRYGDSLSSDTLVQRALVGREASSVSTTSGAVSPVLTVHSATPVRGSGGKVVGAVIAGLDLNSAFVDGIKQQTGLDSSMYGGNTLAATTLTGADGKTRSEGIRLVSNAVSSQVLQKGQAFQGELSLQNRTLFGAFLPIKDVDNANVGMLMIAEPQSLALATAGHSIELTFMLTAALLLFSIAPAYLVSRMLDKQLE